MNKNFKGGLDDALGTLPGHMGSFISTSYQEEERIESAEAETKIPNHPFQKRESKSKRVLLLMTPTLHEKVKAIADQECDSVNNMISRLLEEAVEKHEK